MANLGLLPLQSALAYECLAADQPGLYQVQVELDWQGVLDKARLNAALQAVAIRHPVLRGHITPWDDSTLPLSLPRLVWAGQDAPTGSADVRAPGPLQLICHQIGEGVYRLRFCFHHIAADRLSMEYLLDELVSYYQQGVPADGVFPLDYRAAITPLFPEESALSAARRYWRGALEGAPTHSRWRFGSSVTATGVERVETQLDAAAYQRICAQARALGVTRQAVVLAACAAAMASLSDGTSQVIGIPVGLHDLLALEVPAIGPFVETLPLRLNLTGDSTLASLAMQAQERLAGAVEHRQLPFSEIVRELGLSGSQGSPLIQTVFAWGGEARTWQMGRAQLRLCPPKPYPTLLDFTILAHPDAAGGLWLAIDYAVPRFDAPAARRLLSMLEQALLGEINLSLSTLNGPMPGSAMATWMGADSMATDWVAPMLRRLSAEPDSLALVTESGNWTAGGLAALAADIDAAIVAKVGRPATLVLCAERSPQQVATLLAALAGGHRLALLDPEEAPAMQSRACQAVAADLVLVSATTAGRFASACPQWQLPLRPHSASDPLAYRGLPASLLLFTSGTTGVPRPVVLTVDALSQHASWFVDRTGLSPADRMLQFCSVGFDASLEELLPALGRGTPIVLRSQAASASAESFIEFCDHHQISVADLPTGFFRLLVSELVETGLRLPASLRLVVIGGEAATEALVAQWHAVAPGVTLLNSYGPTETTIVVSAGDAPGLGSPRPGVGLYLLDPWLRPVSHNEVGELYIGGPSLARGYLGHAATTADRFLPDPFSSQAGARMYKTGDLAIRTVDGQLRFVARSDRQVKIRGYRLEPSALEAAWRQLDGVIEAIVVVEQGQLKLAVQLAGNTQLEAVQAAIRNQYASPCWPSRLIAVDSWPTTLRGKIDRPAVAVLLATPVAKPAIDAASDHPLLALIAELAGLPSVRPEQNFLAIGGHSLLALKLVGEARRRLSLRLPVSSLLNAPDFASLLAQLTTSALPVAPLASMACSSIETAILLDESLQTGESPYWIEECVQLDGPLNASQLQHALRALVGVQPHLARRLDTELAGHWQTLALDEVMQAVYGPFSGPDPALHTAPGWRLHYCADKQLLTLRVHHAVMDGRSIAVFWQQLARAYRGQPLADVATPVVAEDSAADAWWQQTLAGADATISLPTDHPATGNAKTAAHSVAIDLEPALLSALQTAGSATLFARVLAVTVAWLQRATRSPDFLLGLAVSTAEQQGCSETIRPLLAMLPARCCLDADLDFAAVQARISETLGQLLDHTAVSAACLSRLLRQAGSGNGLPPFLFDLTDSREAATLDFGSCQASVVAVPTRQVRADVEFSLEQRIQGARLVIRARASLYDAETVAAWAGSWRHFLLQVVHQPQRKLAQQGLIDPHSPLAARQTAGALAEPLDMAGELVRLLEPSGNPVLDTMLVREGDLCLSRRALADRVGAIATRLQGAGVAPGCQVGVVLPRSSDHLASLLAIWRLGAVAVLIDPAHPADRLGSLCARTPLQAILLRDLDDGRRAGLRAGSLIDVAELPHQATLPPPQALGELAYIAFTSGSTGVPRAVMCHWQGFATLLGWSRREIPLGEGDRFLHLAAPAFDITLWELFHPLLSGAQLEILPATQHGDITCIAERVRDRAITAAHFVPSLLGPFLEVADRPSSLRQVIAGGEALSPALYEGVRSLGAVLHHSYGPTETSIFMLCWRGQGPNPLADRLPLGQPIDGCTIEVCDEAGAVLPRGLLGELCISGPQVCQGYLGDARETARRFRPHRDGQRRFHSGDQIRMRADGHLEYHGRQDRQVKINGMRIELAEVETVVESTVGVTKAVAMLKRDPGGTPRLVAYLSGPGAGDPPALQRAVQSTLKQRLPENARPRVLVVLPNLPLTLNGKVDVRALPEPDWTLPVQAARQSADDLEHKVLQVWREVLGRPELALDHDLFAVGGDSISAIRIVSRLRSQGEALGLGDVFRHASPAALAAFLRERAAVADSAGTAGDGPLQLAPAALGWLDYAGPDARQGIQAVSLQLPAGSCTKRLRQAWTTVWRRHDSLRQRVVADASLGWKVDIQTAAGEAPVIEWSADLPGEQVDQRFTATMAAVNVHMGQPAVLGLGAGSAPQAVLAIHHLAIDWQGWQQLLAELKTAYADQPLPPVASFSVAMATLHQHCHWQGGMPEAVQARFTPRRLGSESLTCSLTFDGGLLVRLRNRANERRLPLEALLAAATARAMAECFRQTDIDIDLEADGRQWIAQANLADPLGWFTTLQRLQVQTPAAAENWLDQTEWAYRQASLLQGQTLAPVVLNLVQSGSTPYSDDWQLDLAGSRYLELPPCHAIAVEAVCHPDHLEVALDLDAGQFAVVELQQLAKLLGTALEAMAEDRGSERRYPLTPLQTGMLFDSLRDRSAYHTQICFALDGKPDLGRLREAWRRVCQAHEVFRYRFRWDGLETPYQVCDASLAFAWEEVSAEGDSVAVALQACLQRDRAQPFDLAAPPLSRFYLIKANDGCCLLWSHHHLLFDGWSLPLVTEDVGRQYAALCQDVQLAPPSAQYSDFLAWSIRQPSRTARWRDALAGLSRPCLLAPPLPATNRQPGSRCFTLTAAQSEALRRLAANRRQTLHGVVLAAWGLTLARLTGLTKVACGLVVSQRPDEVAGSESIVGLCMSTVPLVVDIDSQKGLGVLLESVGQHLLDALHHSHGSLSQARPTGAPGLPFDSMLVFENYPGDRQGVALADAGRLRVLPSHEHGGMPFVLVCLPDTEMSFELILADQPALNARAEQIEQTLCRILRLLADSAVPGRC
ncbi:condensation domain-containing protein [Parachitinimonas caeni]|uniref:Condensation domain-containing protein n=1 Tax=Parachitinimonas caeni TaxID=3031301 RepID=A0ABT7DZE3_9NEIS|nr:condensation domain-containing protein [Parachitinimonas caeni]MDK2125433.1 condensation domain-containing protein [Parachitinimonas caeni]